MFTKVQKPGSMASPQMYSAYLTGVVELSETRPHGKMLKISLVEKEQIRTVARMRLCDASERDELQTHSGSVAQRFFAAAKRYADQLERHFGGPHIVQKLEESQNPTRWQRRSLLAFARNKNVTRFANGSLSPRCNIFHTASRASRQSYQYLKPAQFSANRNRRCSSSHSQRILIDLLQRVRSYNSARYQRRMILKP